jgi:hypothetical protein
LSNGVHRRCSGSFGRNPRARLVRSIEFVTTNGPSHALRALHASRKVAIAGCITDCESCAGTAHALQCAGGRDRCVAVRRRRRVAGSVSIAFLGRDCSTSHSAGQGHAALFRKVVRRVQVDAGHTKLAWFEGIDRSRRTALGSFGAFCRSGPIDDAQGRRPAHATRATHATHKALNNDSTIACGMSASVHDATRLEVHATRRDRDRGLSEGKCARVRRRLGLTGKTCRLCWRRGLLPSGPTFRQG